MKFIEQTLSTGEDLLKCLRVSLGTSAPGELSSFSPERWARAADLATKAGLSPLLLHSLPITSPDLNLPRVILNRWFREHLAILNFNNNLVTHLEQFLACLNQKGVPIILLKGICLIDGLYPDRGTRQMEDIDVLIKPEDMETAEAILRGLNYERPCSLIGFPIWHPYHSQFVQSKTRVAIEIHTDISDPNSSLATDTEGLWERSQPIQVGGTNALALAPTDLVSHLGLHLADHLLSAGLFPPALRSLYDIALLSQKRNDEIQWAQTGQAFVHINGKHCVDLSMALVESLFGVASPLVVSKSSKSASATRFSLDILKEHILLSCECKQLDEKIPQFLRTAIMAKDGNSISGFWRRVFISREDWMHRYGPSASLLVVSKKCLRHVSYLLRRHLHPSLWRFGWDTIALKAHYKKVAALRDRIHYE